MGIISAVGGIASAVMGRKAQKDATKSSNQGFNYLKRDQNVGMAQDQGLAAAGNVGALLGLGGDQAGAQAAFDQFRGSTGYQFRLGEGLGAITGNAAAAGLLNSGGTAKALTQYGQDFASAEFGNYLNQLQHTQGQGLQASYNVASQGTSGGATAAKYHRQGAADVANGIGAAAGGMYDIHKNGWGL